MTTATSLTSVISGVQESGAVTCTGLIEWIWAGSQFGRIQGVPQVATFAELARQRIGGLVRMGEHRT